MKESSKIKIPFIQDGHLLFIPRRKSPLGRPQCSRLSRKVLLQENSRCRLWINSQGLMLTEYAPRGVGIHYWSSTFMLEFSSPCILKRHLRMVPLKCQASWSVISRRFQYLVKFKTQNDDKVISLLGCRNTISTG